MDWNNIIDEEMSEQNRATVYTEEMPTSPITVTHYSDDDNHSLGDGKGGDAEEADVLDIYCDDTDIEDSEILECVGDDSRAEMTGQTYTRSGVKGVAATYGAKHVQQSRETTRNTKRAKEIKTDEPLPKSRPNRRVRRLRGRQLQAIAAPLASERSRWNVRWTRDGFENLLYAVCNCNELPNVVFAGLCYQRADVYTMLLRNCNGKRRYWYDLSRRRNRFDELNNRSDDFERAMVWRSKAIGRASTTPGYDLASFAMQNVTTDSRSYNNPLCSLIIITTGDMLTETSINRQLVFSDNELRSDYGGRRRQQISSRYNVDRRRRQNETEYVTSSCRLCRNTAKTVTQDNASVPTFLCWEHSAAHMAASSADLTRMYDAVILDLQFLQDRNTDEITCRIRLINDDSPNTRAGTVVARSCALTIAELVLSLNTPHHSYPLYRGNLRIASESKTSVDLQTAHAYVCPEVHYDDGDLFPSMPGISVGGGSTAGTVRYHDTTLGRVVDMTFCVVSKFQK